MRTFWLAAILVSLLPVFIAGCGSSQPTSAPNAGPPTQPGDPGHPLTGGPEDAKKLGRGPGSDQFQQGLDAGRFGSGKGSGSGTAPGTPK